MTIRIDPEFRDLIPPLRPDERAQLEANIASEGVRDPLVIWQGTLLDGHNRYDIATTLGIPYQTVERQFESREAALLWIYEHQLGRRNLTDDQRAVLASDAQKQRSKLAMKERAAAGNDVRWHNSQTSLSNASFDKDNQKKDTRAAVAREFGLSQRKIMQVRAIEQAAPEMMPAVRAGDKSLADAVREVKRAQVVERLTNVEAVEAKAAQGVYDVLVIDPPWAMEKIERDVTPEQVAFEYPTMTEAELEALKIPAADDAHVWVWTTHKFLPMALRLLEAWGLKYVCTFVWHKPGGFQPFGLPQYNCEFALYARKGTPSFVDTKAFPVCFTAPRGAHSEKPEQFYDIVRRVTAGRKLDMFNRRSIDGFDGWGKEAV